MNTNGNMVLKLNKSLNGLKQSPRCWNKALMAALKSFGLKPSYSNPYLFHSTDHPNPLFLFVHVNDLIFGGTCLDELKSKISLKFAMDDLGLAKYALGIRVIQNPGFVRLIKDKYISKILEEFNIQNYWGTKIPLPRNWKHLKHSPSEAPSTLPFNYQRVIGLLKYLSLCTRPNLAFTVSFLLQFLETPLTCHYQAARHALRYVAHTQGYELILGQNNLGHPPNSILVFWTMTGMGQSLGTPT